MWLLSPCLDASSATSNREEVEGLVQQCSIVTGRVQVRTSTDDQRDVIVPELPRRSAGTRGVKIWSTSDFIYLNQATRECDSPRSAPVVEPPPPLMPDPVRGSGRPNGTWRGSSFF